MKNNLTRSQKAENTALVAVLVMAFSFFVAFVPVAAGAFYAVAACRVFFYVGMSVFTLSFLVMGYCLTIE